MDEYYTIFDGDMSRKDVLKLMHTLIKKDPDFFDSYQFLIDDLFEDGKGEEAVSLLKATYQRAVERIVDNKGHWPKLMRWGFHENRHLMRIIDRYGFYCWKTGNTEEALTVFRHLLKVCPGDNLGARFNILAIHLGLSYTEWKDLFKIEDSPVEGLDGTKLYRWFQENAKQFPDDLLEHIEDEDVEN